MKFGRVRFLFQRIFTDPNAASSAYPSSYEFESNSVSHQLGDEIIENAQD